MQLPTIPLRWVVAVTNYTLQVGSWRNQTGLEGPTGGEYTKTGGISYLGTTPRIPTGYVTSLAGVHIRFGCVPEAPVASVRVGCEDPRDPECWFGWHADLVARLAEVSTIIGG